MSCDRSWYRNSAVSGDRSAREDDGRFPGSWQTGLYFEDFRPKPAAYTFWFTLLPFRDGDTSVGIFGHIRNDRNGGLSIRIEGQKPDGTWEPIDTRNASGGDNHPDAKARDADVRIHTRAPEGTGRAGHVFRLALAEDVALHPRFLARSFEDLLKGATELHRYSMSGPRDRDADSLIHAISRYIPDLAMEEWRSLASMTI